MSPSDPLHGVTLEALLTDLVERIGWEELAERVPVRCFEREPSVKSSLKILRRTPWARARVEQLYVSEQRSIERKRKRNARRAARRAAAAEAAAEPVVADGPSAESGSAADDADGLIDAG